jgi:acyl-CoA thioester hydrolase
MLGPMAAYRYRCAMRWADMDAFGIVNNVVYARYLEQARVELLFSTAAAAELEDLARGVVVARLEIDYRRPLTWRTEGIDVVLWTAEVGAGSFTLAYEVRDDGYVYAQARTVLVPYDFAAVRSRRLLEREKVYLRQYAGPSQD